VTSGYSEGQMGEVGEGSSGAAQGALTDESEDSRGGLLSRIIGALSPTDTGAPVPSLSQPDIHGPAILPVPGMVNLRRMRVEDVMIPKAEIVSVPVEISQADLVELFRSSGLSRLPVFKGTLDSPVGLVHLKDFALTHGFDGKGERYALRKLLRPLLYAPPSMPIGVLLQKMQTDRIHMALVIDEYGGVDGLVTIEDLIEQVIGEIEDEHDLEEGEVIRHPGGAEFEIVDADPRRIKRLRVQLPKTASHG